ncbi:hypothetical protein [Mesorhizobium sp. SP-1A]|uniref:hypothetical protein n=1 Tax=Mesorhizobium sp. SP-1A TaxID=3077840 RepID=UPI0028F6D63D|nr:hypothetical protein [Mesorhizobium sp. SP-1A]
MKNSLAFIIGVFIILFGMVPAQAMCRLDVNQVVASSSYFNTRLVKSPEKQKDGSVVFSHVDDPRMVVSLSFGRADPVGHISRSAYVAKVDEFAGFMVGKAKAQGRWAEKSVHPHDPVASVVVEETKIDKVGDALVGHMEALFTPDCILIADFVSPSSQNLRSRWVQMAQEITTLRSSAAHMVVPISWEAEDTSPAGWKAVLAGLGTPLVVMILINALLGHVKELDPPSIHTRTVLGTNAFLVFSALIYQYGYYLPIASMPFEEMKYLDSFLLLTLVGILCVAGALLAQRAARLGLISACVGGFALLSASYLGWTPDVNISLAVGLSMIIMGGLAYAAWSMASKPKKSVIEGN